MNIGVVNTDAETRKVQLYMKLLRLRAAAPDGLL